MKKHPKAAVLPALQHTLYQFIVTFNAMEHVQKHVSSCYHLCYTSYKQSLPHSLLNLIQDIYILNATCYQQTENGSMTVLYI